MTKTAPGTRPGEDGLIARYFAPLAGAGADGLRDDAATLTPGPGCDLVLTVDAIVAGVHYLPGDPPSSVARKALGVNLSDLAAKGAAPRGFLLTLALPDDWTEEWLAGFSTGLAEAASAFGCPLLGGDTVRSAGPMLISVTAFGEVPAGRMVRRTTAQVGDILCISGTIGDAALGLPIALGSAGLWGDGIGGDARATLLDRYRHPRPRLALAPVLRRYARAAMDVSDGLAGDLAKMLVDVPGNIPAGMPGGGPRSAEIDLDAVPLSEAARAAIGHDPRLVEIAVTGGDDYEILCAVPPEALAECLAAATAMGLALTPIGTVTGGDRPPVFRRRDGTEATFAARSFSHF